MKLHDIIEVLPESIIAIVRKGEKCGFNCSALELTGNFHHSCFRENNGFAVWFCTCDAENCRHARRHELGEYAYFPQKYNPEAEQIICVACHKGNHPR